MQSTVWHVVLKLKVIKLYLINFDVAAKVLLFFPCYDVEKHYHEPTHKSIRNIGVVSIINRNTALSNVSDF